MAKLSIDERVELILLCGRENYSLRMVADEFNAKHPDRHIHFTNVGKLLNKFKNTGSVHDIKHGSKPMETEEQELIVANAEAHSTQSLEEQGKATGWAPTTVRKTLKRYGYKAYKPKTLHAITDQDPAHRESMAEWFNLNIIANPNFLKSVLFSDESPFKVNGTRNPSHEFHWADKNPHIFNPCRNQGSQSVMVWLGLYDERLVGPYFFEGTVSGQSYLQLLRDRVVPDLRAAGTFPTWFQQDGAPPHYAVIVRQYLDETFPGHWIGRGGFQEWSARSPDMNPLDFSIWGILKDRVYKHEIQNIDTLKQKIQEECLSFTNIELRNIYDNMAKRALLCAENHGQHFEQLL